MKNLLAATQTAYFTALKTIEDDADLTALAGAPVKIYTHVPAGAQPPFLKIGHLSSDAENELGDCQIERIAVEIIAVNRGTGNGVTLALLHAARLALDGQTLPSPDAYIQPPVFLNAEIGDPINIDGLTYIGLLNFESLVEPTE